MEQFPKGSSGGGSSERPSTSSSHSVKRESYPRIPPPAQSFASTVQIPTSQNRPGPSGEIALSVRPLSQITDDDQMSTISSATLVNTNPVAGCSINSSPFIRPFQAEEVTVERRDRCTPPPHEEEALDWRASINSVRERLNYILDNTNMYQDVVFDVRGSMTSERVEAHKLILRIASPVFDKIFDTAASSSGVNDTGDGGLLISVINVEPSTFKLLLKFIYTDKMDMAQLSGDEILNLLRAAKDYGVVQLYHNCVETLKSGISDDVALKLCGMDESLEDSLLLETALNHISSKAYNIFPSDGFLQITLKNIIKLAERDDLRIDEMSLFTAVLRWAEYKCMQTGTEMKPANLRLIMEDVITKIRFPLISASEFAELNVRHPNILTGDENVKIYQYICLEPSKRDILIPHMPFNTKPRFSKKEFDLEMDDSRSCSRHNESPLREPSLLLNAQNEWTEVTSTEPESETASLASTISDSNKPKRKYDGSDSGSSKKRKKEKRRHKKPKNVHLNDLFGDTVDRTIIALDDRKISFNDFIEDCSKLEYKNLIEKIELKNVKIKDIMRLNSQKVDFPNLKEFNLNIQIDESIKNVIVDLRVENLLFFSTRKKTWLFGDVWKMNIDITVTINKVIVVRISPQMNHIVLNKFHGAPLILKSLSDEPIKSIIYSYAHLPEMRFPVTLRRLVLLGIIDPRDLNSFLQDFKHLKYLALLTPAQSDSITTLKFAKNFMSSTKLQNLALGCFKLVLESSVRFSQMEDLYLWKTSWGPQFEETFSHHFPNLKKITISTAVGSQRLLENILKLRTLTSFVSWACDWHLVPGSNVANIIKASGLSETDKSFQLEKTGSSQWKGEKIQFTSTQKLYYDKLQYDFLYENYDTFNVCS